MKKIVITGGNGFIGSNLVNFLIKKKFFVINIDKNKYSKGSYLLKNIKSKNYKFYNFDINNKKILKIFTQYQPDAIFNLAAETHVDRSIDSPKDFIYSNILGTFNILEQIRNYKKKNKRKIRLIHISTDEVYGDCLEGAFVETDRLNPSNPYSASKAAAEMLVLSYKRTYGLNYIITRSANNYGPPCIIS